MAQATRKTKQDVVSAFRRSEILDAARRVFSRRGFEAAHMEEIAREAGIAKGTVYLYFPSKSDIYEEAIVDDIDTLFKIRKQRIEACTTVFDKIRTFFLVTLEHCESRRDFFRIFMTATTRCTFDKSHLPARVQNSIREDARKITMYVNMAIETGQLRSISAEVFTRLLQGGLREMIERRVLEPSARTPAEDTNLLMDLFWNGIKPTTGGSFSNQ